METFHPDITPDALAYQAYRQTLTEQLLEETDHIARREALLQAQQTPEYSAAKAWRTSYRDEVQEHRQLAGERLALGLIDEAQATTSQYEITELFQKALADDADPDLLERLARDPSPFVRFEVLDRVRDNADNPLLLAFTNDADPELRAKARRTVAALEVQALQQLSSRPDLVFTTTDFFADVKDRQGERFLVIQKADRDQLREQYGVSEDELKKLHLSYHFKPEPDLDPLWWGCIDVRVLPDGQKVWLLEEIQSDFLSKTRNKPLREEYFYPCTDCDGKGMIKHDRTQTACEGCCGAAKLPSYPSQVLADVVELAAQRGVSQIIMPNATSMVEKFSGMLKQSKATVFYDTLPRHLGMTPIELDEPLTFGHEDGGVATSNRFWSRKIEDAEYDLGQPSTSEIWASNHRGKLDFLIHPNYRTAMRGEVSEQEETAQAKWEIEVGKIAADPRRVLIILSSSTAEELAGEKAVDAALIANAEARLQERCIVVPYTEEDLDVYAAKIKAALLESGLIDEASLPNLSSSAFGEYAEACVVQIADELNKHLGLNPKTQVRTGRSLSIDGEDSQSVNSAVREVINRLHLQRVVAHS